MNATQHHYTKQRLLTALALLIIITVLVLGVKAFSKKPAAQTAVSPPASSSPSPAAAGASTASYKDGTYTATGTYSSPGGEQAIDVSLTVTANKVSASMVTPKGSDSVATLYQNDFVQDYKQYVTGKNLNDINVKQVSGSSLTSNGFNAALKQIKTQAEIHATAP